MIYTLTTNPAIDMNICCNGLEPNKVTRTFGAVYSPNGKGLNVTFTLGHFGVPSKILGFFGGFSGKYIVEESGKRGFEVLPVWVDDITRINVFLNDGTAEYTMPNEGSFVPAEKQQELLRVIENAEDMEYLSISGSLPKGVSTDLYDDILQLCQRKGIRVILDISSAKLTGLLKYKPLLIKPNDEELQQILGVTLQTEEDMIAVLRRLHEMGAQNILLTLGEKGSYFYNGQAIYYAGVQPVKLLSSACAGDASLAAFLSIWLKQPCEIADAMKNAAAVGANVAESAGLGDFSKVEEYRKNIQVRQIL